MVLVALLSVSCAPAIDELVAGHLVPPSTLQMHESGLYGYVIQVCHDCNVLTVLYILLHVIRMPRSRVLT